MLQPVSMPSSTQLQPTLQNMLCKHPEVNFGTIKVYVSAHLVAWQVIFSPKKSKVGVFGAKNAFFGQGIFFLCQIQNLWMLSWLDNQKTILCVDCDAEHAYGYKKKAGFRPKTFMRVILLTCESSETSKTIWSNKFSIVSNCIVVPCWVKRWTIALPVRGTNNSENEKSTSRN